MKSLMLDHAFRFVERVVFVIGEENRRSRKAVEKIGGTLFRDAEHIQAVRRFPSSCTPSPARHTSSRPAPQPPHWASALLRPYPPGAVLACYSGVFSMFRAPRMLVGGLTRMAQWLFRLSPSRILLPSPQLRALQNVIQTMNRLTAAALGAGGMEPCPLMDRLP